MNTHTHTPGPFHITQNTTPGQFGTDTKIRSADNSVIAVLHVNAKGNGPLIAAAPELLAALKESLATLEYLGLRDNKLPGMMQRINYAIAKAEGNA
jgi:hypothetical protein